MCFLYIIDQIRRAYIVGVCDGMLSKGILKEKGFNFWSTLPLIVFVLLISPPLVEATCDERKPAHALNYVYTIHNIEKSEKILIFIQVR